MAENTSEIPHRAVAILESALKNKAKTLTRDAKYYYIGRLEERFIQSPTPFDKYREGDRQLQRDVNEFESILDKMEITEVDIPQIREALISCANDTHC